MSAEASAAELDAAAELHHQLFTGLLLSLAGHHGLACAAALVERTFRRQHDERFLPGLARLGLAALPPADACARYIYLANRAGGVDVEYVPDGPHKAWVRYPPPRWAYEGPAICALDDGVTEAFLRGFHARCGESLGVPGLRFVCTGMTTAGDPGLEGYFEDTGEALAPAQRLVLRRGPAAPPFDPAVAPALPWDAARAALARRNYAVRYIELMLPALAELLGDDAGGQAARRAAHLVGLQLYRDTAARLGVRAGSRERFVDLLVALCRGTGHAIAGVDRAGGLVRVVRFRLGDDPRVFHAWSGLLSGALAAHDRALRLRCEQPFAWRVA